MEYRTIRRTAEHTGLPEWLLRQRLKQGVLPGFYAGTRFYVDCEKLADMLADESLCNLRDNDKN